MPAIGPAQPVDYYQALALNPSATSEALLPALNQRVALSPPGPERAYAEQARAVLADPGKRRVYDQRLHNPHAKPWTPQELHELAVAQSTRSATGFLAQLKTAPTRILATVAGVLLVGLVVIIVAVSCTGGGTTDVASNPDASNSKPDANTGAGDASCEQIQGSLVEKAAWTRGDPGYAVVLTQATDLPTPIATGLAESNFDGLGTGGKLGQLQDKGVFVVIDAWFNRDMTDHAAVFSADGTLRESLKRPTMSSGPANWPKSFDLEKDDTHGYHHITAGQGVQIPAEAGGTKPGQTYALAILPDAFDDDVVWVLLRGGKQLYKGTLVRFRGEAPTDPRKCTPLG
ncbi:hypothetical protein [Gordonia neofelifaecis]|uniref:Heat shock protein DnaJ domain-containing protein n=1 Tax=Gordonia neofelifaecis NRRL B-59395 TaxID=644548 RepID=F1YE46_9ACTN|nr:hypothetical protein [Gordonia neofelifaecis]EGD57136.1 heat shock protein DnaJ domain-containing protein [Gordonia neofelifaecis NRRL B-59395]